MKKSNKARKYSSELLNKLIADISPLEFQQTKEKMLLASRIGQLIMQKGNRKVELAKKLNKRPSEITKWLSGTQNITMDILTLISFELGVEISSLFVKDEKQYYLGATSLFLTSVKEPK